MARSSNLPRLFSHQASSSSWIDKQSCCSCLLAAVSTFGALLLIYLKLTSTLCLTNWWAPAGFMDPCWVKLRTHSASQGRYYAEVVCKFYCHRTAAVHGKPGKGLSCSKTMLLSHRLGWRFQVCHEGHPMRGKPPKGLWTQQLKYPRPTSESDHRNSRCCQRQCIFQTHRNDGRSVQHTSDKCCSGVAFFEA